MSTQDKLNELFDRAIALSHERGVAEEQIRTIKFLKESADINGIIQWHADELLAALYGDH